MRASSIAVIAAALAVPSVCHAQDQGLVGGKVGPNLGSSMSSGQSGSAAGAYAPRTIAPQERPGFAGAVSPGQVAPRTTPVTQQWGGMGVSYVNGRRVLVDTASGRIARVLN